MEEALRKFGEATSQNKGRRHLPHCNSLCLVKSCRLQFRRYCWIFRPHRANPYLAAPEPLFWTAAKKIVVHEVEIVFAFLVHCWWKAFSPALQQSVQTWIGAQLLPALGVRKTSATNPLSKMFSITANSKRRGGSMAIGADWHPKLPVLVLQARF